jgi:hypothetical protein
MATRFEGGSIEGGVLDGEDGDEPGLQINGIPIPFDGSVAFNDTNGRLVSAINGASAQTGVEASTTAANVDGMPMVWLVLEAGDGRDILVQVTDRGATVTGLSSGRTHGRVRIDEDAPFTVGGTNPGAAGLAPGRTEPDPGRWRVTARSLECGGRPSP